MYEDPAVKVPLSQIYADLVKQRADIEASKLEIGAINKRAEDHEKRLRGVEWKVYSVVGGVLMGFTTAIVLIVKQVLS